MRKFLRIVLWSLFFFAFPLAAAAAEPGANDGLGAGGNYAEYRQCGVACAQCVQCECRSGIAGDYQCPHSTIDQNLCRL